MQDRYAGDIGDYGKIGLLKAFCSHGMSVAINWYFVDSVETEKKSNGTFKQEDGKYLIPERMKICDPKLAEMLTGIARSAERSVKLLEQAEFVPDAIYFNEPISVADRLGWHKRALDKLAEASLVFADPDNGMLVKSVGRNSLRSVKYMFYDEVRDYVERGQSVLIYSHRSRMLQEQYFHEICSKLQEATGIAEKDIWKITFPKYSVRDYLAVPASDEHRKKIESVFTFMEQGVWGKTGMCRILR